MVESLKAIADFINQVGFPIAVTACLLYQFFVMHSANLKGLAALTQELALFRAEMSLRPACQNFHPAKPTPAS